MILFPPAKINLGLNVLRKRNDGYHEIESCMYAIPVTDVIEILPSEEFGFTSSGLRIGGDPDEDAAGGFPSSDTGAEKWNAGT